MLTKLDEIVVTGIRSSLESSMRLKRDAQGVVDGIVAEDIGKFPDTNLAESLQRISGVSIDRSIGEGSRVTVRGVGPDFNLVMLNGRQMPGSSLQDTGASNSRSFDFANLASEAIAGVEVYKTSRSETPTGGIGASINIKTTRPLDAPGMHTSIGVKAVNDTSADNLPSALQGDSFTPEISGIFSNTFADGKFGVALTASYQERSPRLQPGGGRQRLASVRGRREQLGHDSAARRSRLGEHHQPARRQTTRIRCRRTCCTASTVSSESAPTVS